MGTPPPSEKKVPFVQGGYPQYDAPWILAYSHVILPDMDKKDQTERLLAMPLDEFLVLAKAGMRIRNALHRGLGPDATVADLLGHGPGHLLTFKNFGMSSGFVIDRILHLNGLAMVDSAPTVVPYDGREGCRLPPDMGGA